MVFSWMYGTLRPAVRAIFGSLVAGAVSDVKIYLKSKLDALPKLVAREVAALLVDFKEDRIEPAREKIEEEISGALSDVREAYPVLAALEPILLQAGRDKLVTHPKLQGVVSAYGSIEGFLASLDEDKQADLADSIAEFAASAIDDVIDAVN